MGRVPSLRISLEKSRMCVGMVFNYVEDSSGHPVKESTIDSIAVSWWVVSFLVDRWHPESHEVLGSAWIAIYTCDSTGLSLTWRMRIKIQFLNRVH